MRLLVVTPEYLPTSGGGIVTFYRHLLPEVARQGVDVTVLVGSAMSQPGGEACVDGVKVVGLDRTRFERRLRQFDHLQAMPELARHLAAAWGLRDAADAHDSFDCVEAVDWGLLFVPWVLSPPASVLVRGHGSSGQIALREPDGTLAPQRALLLAIERAVLRRASVVTTYSRMNAAEWQGLLGRPVSYVPPALPVPAEGANASAAWALVLARVQRWKGPDILAEAVERHSELPRIRWVGRDVPDTTNNAPSTLAAMRAKHPIAWRDRIDHRSSVDASTALEWIRAARVVVVPSTWDVFNYAGAEGLAAGAAVVASDGAGVGELIEHGVNGWRVPRGDAEALAQALREAASLDPPRRARIGEAARATVACDLDPARVASRNIALWREAGPRVEDPDPVDEILRPSGGMVPRGAHLSQYALRELLAHVGQRLRRKVVTR